MKKREYLKIENRITRAILTCILIPCMLVVVVNYVLLGRMEKRDHIKNSTYYLEKAISQIEQKMELCSVVATTLTESDYLKEEIGKVCHYRASEDRAESTRDILELMEFKEKGIGTITMLMNTVPFISNIRLYVEQQDMKEFYPSLYRMERASEHSWYGEDVTDRGAWYLNFDKGREGNPFYRTCPDSLAYVCSVRIDTDVEAVLEIVVPVSQMLKDLNIDEGSDIVFCGDDGTIYGTRDKRLQEEIRKVIVDVQQLKRSEEGIAVTRLDMAIMAIRSRRMDTLGGNLFYVSHIADNIVWYYLRIVIILLAVILVFLLIILLVNGIIHRAMSYLNRVIENMKTLGYKNEIRLIPLEGDDEIRELAEQFNRLQERNRKLIKETVFKETLIKETQIKALQNQINAHFMYNVLEDIKMMAVIHRCSDIVDCVTAFGKMLHYNLKMKADKAFLWEEINCAENFLVLVNIRYEHEVTLAVNILPECVDIVLPRMTVQTIIENSVSHGLYEIEQDTSIYLKAYIQQGQACIEISDSGTGMDEETLRQVQRCINGEIEDYEHKGNGIGLRNINERIRMLYGDAYGLEIASQKNHYTKVTVRVPFGESSSQNTGKEKDNGENSDSGR